MDRISDSIVGVPAEMQVELLHADSSNAKCCKASPSRLQLVAFANPNDLLSEPEGIGERSYVNQDQPISYTIGFENPAEALAPVQDITVMAKLDSGIDMKSIFSGSSSHPDVTRVIIDEPRNTITWVFNDINLPPNREPPQGEAWVRFSARLLEDMPSGTMIGAKAAIRFDFRPPIETNEVTYTLDSQAPSTQVSAVPPVQLSPTFQVSWEGGDGERGSGIQSVALLVSKNGGPFEVFETTSGTAFSFQGEPGATYGLATQGIDLLGHAEAPPPGPDVVVTVGQSLFFEPGLQLVGIPVVTDGDFRDLLVVPGSAWSGWDASKQNYLSGKMDAGFPAGVDSRPGYGLWARFENQAKVVITGQPVPHDRPYPIDLHAGWNLIASPFTMVMPWSIDGVKVRVEDEEVTVKEAQQLGWVEDFLWRWNGEAYEMVYDSGVVPGIASSLEPFRGYWIQAHRDLTLVLPPPGNQD
jgi:hypothetical protein